MLLHSGLTLPMSHSVQGDRSTTFFGIHFMEICLKTRIIQAEDRNKSFFTYIVIGKFLNPRC